MIKTKNIAFDDMIANMLSDKICNLIVTETFVRVRKLNIYFVFITQSYFVVPRIVRLNSTNYLVMKLPSKGELQQIAFNHLSDIDFQDYQDRVFMKSAT